MAKDLYIIGAGGLGRELLQRIKDTNKVGKKWNIVGFLDDNPDALNEYECDYHIVGSIQGWNVSENEYYALGIANPRVKEKITTLYKSNGAKFASIIHPTAHVSEFAKVGEGLVMYPNSLITANVTVGDFVTLLSSNVGHDVKIGSYSTISSFCDVTGGVVIGKRVFLGSHTTIIPKRTIGNDAYIAAGSVVITNIKDGIHVFGNPAVRID